MKIRAGVGLSARALKSTWCVCVCGYRKQSCEWEELNSLCWIWCTGAGLVTEGKAQEPESCFWELKQSLGEN